MIVTLMTLMLATSFSRAANEHLMADGSEAAVNALTIAEAGLDAFFHDTSSVRPADGDSVRYNVTGGYAWVFAHELQRPADTVANDIVYVIEARGTLIDTQQGDVPQAARSMMQLARWQTGSIQTNALFTAANGIYRRSGGEYTLEAYDGGANNLCQTGQQVARSRTRNWPPNADYEDGYGPITGGWTDSVVAVETGIDWGDVVAGGFEADYNSVQVGDTAGFTTQLITGDLTLNSGDRGSGLLIVTGDLYTAETGNGLEVEWRGLVLVGGRLETNSQLTDFHGMVVTGLNAGLGSTVLASVVGGTNVDIDFLYEPCFVAQSLERLNGFVPMDGTRIDHWAAY